MKKMLAVVAAALSASAMLFASDPVEGLWKPAPKKLIDMSWSNPSVSYLRDNLERMEKEAPIDGVSIRMKGKRMIDGKETEVWAHTVWSQIPYDYNDFAEEIAILKSLKFKKFTDNFIFTATYGADVDWFSDDCWKIISNHFAVISRIAREAKLKGLVLDVEEYGKQFWCNYPNHSHADAVKIARKRGQQVGQAIFTNFPDAKLLCMFLFSFGTYQKGDAWAQILSHSFFNGIYDVMPPTATMIEGHEYFGYAAKSKQDFERLLYDVDRTFMNRVAANNIKKYRTQTQLAAPLYPDSYFNKENPVTRLFLHPEIDDLPPLEFVKRQVNWALNVSDEYVWIYSEEGCWWSKSEHPRAQKTWDEVCPGINNLINSIHSVDNFDPGDSPNLLAIPTLDEEPGKWNFWTAYKDDGQGGWKDGIVWMEGITHNGCVNQSVPIQGGKLLLLRVKARPRTPISGSMALSVYFRDTTGTWINNCGKTVSLTVDTNNKWQTLALQIETPPNAGILSFQLNASELKAGEAVEFKEPALYELK